MMFCSLFVHSSMKNLLSISCMTYFSIELHLKDINALLVIVVEQVQGLWLEVCKMVAFVNLKLVGHFDLQIWSFEQMHRLD